MAGKCASSSELIEPSNPAFARSKLVGFVCSKCMGEQFVLAKGVVELSRDAKHSPGMCGPWHDWHFDVVFFQKQVLNRINVEW